MRQNDPTSGCAFDPVHGYGIVLNTNWAPPTGTPPITYYPFHVYDGAHRELTGSFTWDFNSTAPNRRLVMCKGHVDDDAARGATWAVAVCLGSCSIESDFAVATFDFQPCGEAGVPACR